MVRITGATQSCSWVSILATDRPSSHKQLLLLRRLERFVLESEMSWLRRFIDTRSKGTIFLPSRCIEAGGLRSIQPTRPSYSRSERATKIASFQTEETYLEAMKDISTFWLLLGQYGGRMTMEQLRDAFFPHVSVKTMQNKASAGRLPCRTGDVYDTRDVADWWDEQRRH